MAENSYPVAGGASVTDWAYEKLLGDVLGSGVIGATGQTVLFGDSTGLQVKVSASKRAMVRGFMWESDTGITRAIASNTSGQTRFDLGVLRLDRADFSVRFQVKQGTPSGSPVAPSLTQQDGPSGVWEIPLGQITVAHNASTITSGNVAPLEYYAAPSGVGAHQARNITLANGQVRGNSDGTAYVGANGNKLIYEDTGWLNQAASGGWTASYIWYRRRNGVVYYVASTQRTGANLAAGTDSVTAVLPASVRPTTEIPLIGYIDSANLVHGEISPSDGGVRVMNYETTLSTGRFVTWHAVSYPI